jgi:lipopolysaccharide transport system permease protein
MNVTKYNVSPKALLTSLRANQDLILALAKREILGRYRGSTFGLAWSFFNPLLMLAIYTFFFSFVLKAKWGGSDLGSPADFAVILFVGLIIHSMFSECIMRAPTLISGNVNFVKKVVFPLDIFPWVALLSALFHMIVSLFVLLIMMILFGEPIPWTIIFLPLIFVPFLLMTVGVTWFLAAIGVFFKDVSQMMSFASTILLFLSPIFYPLASLPPSLQTISFINPLTLIVEQTRQVGLLGQFPDFAGLALYTLISLIVAYGGFWFFQRLRKDFADVL